MLDGWTYRKQITIDHTKIDSNLTDFPVLVKLTSSNFDFSKARSDGYDIRFCSPDESTLYKYERERHDSSSQVAEYWVKIPSISSSSDTTFWIEYGNASASDGADPTNAWDSNFKAVYHLTGATVTDIKDSTSNANNITGSYGSPAGFNVDAKIGKGMSFDGVNDEIYAPDSSSLSLTTALTIEMWIKLNDNTKNGILVYKFWDGTGRSYGIGHTGDEILVYMGDPAGGIGTGFVSMTTTDLDLANNTWYYIVVRWSASGGTVRVYKNAVVSATTASKSNNIYDNTCPLRIGDRYPSESSNPFDGIIDEIRISNVERSAAWIKASYHSDNDTLLSFGSEEANNIIFAPVQTITAYSLSPNVFSSITIPVPTQVISFSQFIPDILSKWRGILKHKTLWSGISKHSSSWDNLSKSSAPYLWSSGYYPWGSDKYPWLKYGGFQTIKKS